jgi:hypothetical protein
VPAPLRACAPAFCGAGIPAPESSGPDLIIHGRRYVALQDDECVEGTEEGGGAIRDAGGAEGGSEEGARVFVPVRRRGT